MVFGYVKNIAVLKNPEKYKHECERLQADRLFADNHGDHAALRDLLKYARPGDVIVCDDIRDLCDTVGDFMELTVKLHHMNISIVCQSQSVDTANMIWYKVLNSLDVYNENSTEIPRGRIPRIIEDIDNYIELVDKNAITVDEACEALKIGRSTYYRRYRQVKNPDDTAAKERHPELFPALYEKVCQGEMSVHEACHQMGIGVGTFYRLREKHQKLSNNI